MRPRNKAVYGSHVYVNSFTVVDVFPLCIVDEMIHKIGRGRYISLLDAKSGYWQFLVRPEDRCVGLRLL